MAWTNQDLIVFHGTTWNAAQVIERTNPDPRRGSRYTDFGRGFYVTTNRKQAENWANERARPHLNKNESAAVLEYAIDRDRLSALADLVFVLEDRSTGFWDFVAHCRSGVLSSSGTPDHCRPANGHYSVVYGPVTLWPQTLVLKDCDQISLHDEDGIGLLVHKGTDAGTPLFP
jgi:hypothetical protein